MSKRKKASDPSLKVIARNKRARFDYELIERFEAGIALTGSEVKMLRAGKATIAEAYVRIKNGEAWLIGANIPEYPNASYNNHETDRPRKLLLHKAQLKKLHSATKEKGLTIVPLQLYLRGSRFKLEIGLGRGKKTHDKRQSLKKKQASRDMARGKY